MIAKKTIGFFDKNQLFIDGVKTYSYTRKGTGKKVLLVHGWGGFGLQFHAIIKKLIKQDVSIVTFDAVGHGESGGEFSNFFFSIRA